MKRLLDGIKIVEVASMVSGPYCGKILADLGAEVIKVEKPVHGDKARCRGPFLDGAAEPDNSALFLYINLGKKGITLDLRQTKGQNIFHRLIENADILIEDILPGKKAEMGLDPKLIRERTPRLVHISITPMGSSGPYKDFKTHHLNRYMAGGDGSAIFVREEDLDRPPIQGPGYLADYETGVGAAIATLGALCYRDISGEGQFIDCSAQEWCIYLSSLYLLKYPNQKLAMDRYNMKYRLGGIMECHDGYVMLLLVEDHHWWRLIKTMGDPSFASDEKFNTHYKRTQHQEELNAHIQKWFRQYSKEELYHMLQKQKIPFSPVYSPEEVLASPQLKKRQFFFTHENPAVGPLTIPSVPYRFSRCGYVKPRPAPGLGEHNHDIVGSIGHIDKKNDDLEQGNEIKG
ncbi:MAG: CoA transferase, partial [Desulfatiglandales bacterium]